MKNIYVDMDGVVADWMKLACALCNIDEKDIYTRKYLKQCRLLENIIGADNMWNKINELGLEFSIKLELLPWAKRLIDELQPFGKVSFLTSPGNLQLYPESAARASYGKTIWVNKHFFDIPLIITKNKELLANNDSILIDDHESNIIAFKENGGKGFLWPNQYLLFDKEIDIEQIFKDLKDIVK